MCSICEKTSFVQILFGMRVSHYITIKIIRVTITYYDCYTVAMHTYKYVSSLQEAFRVLLTSMLVRRMGIRMMKINQSITEMAGNGISLSVSRSPFGDRRNSESKSKSPVVIVIAFKMARPGDENGDLCIIIHTHCIR